jgi:hypothetical protein
MVSSSKPPRQAFSPSLHPTPLTTTQTHSVNNQHSVHHESQIGEENSHPL